MHAKWLALAVGTAACGSVARQPSPDAAPPGDAATTDGTTTPARIYRGALAESSPVTFGGPYMGTNYCFYTITLKQLDVSIGILPGGQVASGSVQNVNVETPTPPCMLQGIPPAIVTYSFQSAKPTANGLQLTFAGASTNVPRVTLTVDLATVGSAVQAQLGFHRADQVAPFDWSVVTTVSLSGQ